MLRKDGRRKEGAKEAVLEGEGGSTRMGHLCVRATSMVMASIGFLNRTLRLTKGTLLASAQLHVPLCSC